MSKHFLVCNVVIELCIVHFYVLCSLSCIEARELHMESGLQCAEFHLRLVLKNIEQTVCSVHKSSVVRARNCSVCYLKSKLVPVCAREVCATNRADVL